VGFFAGSMEDGDSGQVKGGEGNPRDVTDYSTADLNDLMEDPVPAIADILFKTLVPGPKLRREMDCQLEKRITLSFDELNNLVPGGKAWSMNQPVQIVKIGSFAILALPCEVTTMSGRRLKADVKKSLEGVTEVVVNSTSNDDLRYLATREEYASQQYEGGATLMGPYSLNAIRQIVCELAATFTPGVEPPSYAVDLASVEAGLEKVSVLQVAGNVVFDDKPLLKKFGDVITQPAAVYARGSRVSAVFWGAHPNNNLTVGSSESYLVVEKRDGAAWKAVAHDWDPSTRYIWKRDSVANSRITIEWDVPAAAVAGEYRLRHVGYWKSGWTGIISRYEGATKSFIVN
jgi:neutral ceramidase